MSRSVLLLFATATLILTAAHVRTQERPPIPNVTGTLVLEGTVDQTYAGGSTMLIKASNGLRHLFHVTKKTALHGDEASFDELAPGSRVIVHYAVDAGEKTAVEVDRVGERGVREIEGLVTGIDRTARQLSIQLADGSHETLRLTERAARHVGKAVDRLAGSGRVIVYYTEEDGGRIAHYFKEVRKD